MAKIIGNTTATPNPRPDWNQTDEKKADYIKNKPELVGESKGNGTEIFNDYVNNNTNIPYAHIEGFNNKAEIQAYNIEYAGEPGTDTIIVDAYCQFSEDIDIHTGATIMRWDYEFETGDTWMVFRKENGRIVRYQGKIYGMDQVDGGASTLLELDGDTLPDDICSSEDDTFLNRLIVNGGSKGSHSIKTEDILEAGVYIHMEGSDNIGSLNTHVEGEGNQALGYGSHVQGCGIIARDDYGSVRGVYNDPDGYIQYLDVVGNGDPDTKTRSNAYTLDWDGNAWFSGDVTVNTNKDKLATEKVVDEKIATIKNSVVGEKTKDGGEIFNDYENNQALCEFSTAMGHKTKAGMRAFRIVELGLYSERFEYDIYDENGNHIGTTFGAYGFRLDAVDDEMAIGDVYSACIGNVWSDLGRIVYIDKNENIVYVDNYPTGAKLQDAKVVEEKPWENTFSITEKPHIGTIDVGFGALANGLETIALRVGSVANGYQTKAMWIGSDANGIRTFASFAAMARGVDCEAIGYYSYAGGLKCYVYCQKGFAHGDQLISSKTQMQAIFGIKNEIDDDALFIVGSGGIGKTIRKNAFVVKKDGRATIETPPIDYMDVTNKGYVDTTTYQSLGKASNSLYVTDKIILSEAEEIATIHTTGLPQKVSLYCRLNPNLIKSTNLLTTYDTSLPKTSNGITFSTNGNGDIHIKGETGANVSVFVLKNNFTFSKDKLYGLADGSTINELVSQDGSSGVYLYVRQNNDSSKIQYKYTSKTVKSVQDTFKVGANSDYAARIQISVMPYTKVDMILKPRLMVLPSTVTMAAGGKVYDDIKTNSGGFYLPTELNDVNPYKVTCYTCGLDVTASYHKDINKAYEELKQAIISLGGNV